MVGVQEVFSGNYFEEFLFDGQRRFAGCKTDAVGETKKMGVDGDGRLAKSNVEDYIRRFAPNTGQGFKGGSLVRHLAAMLFE